MTFNIMTFSIMIFSIMALIIMTCSIMTFSTMTCSIVTFNIIAFSIITLSIIILNTDCCMLGNAYAECCLLIVVLLSVMAFLQHLIYFKNFNGQKLSIAKKSID
jgi:hypothetical protein